MDQHLYCSLRQRLSDRPELSQLKESGQADSSDMIRHSELAVSQNAYVQPDFFILSNVIK